jgi:hypothetical protein
MNRVGFASRLGAAVAALAGTVAIVWALSSYAYPGAPDFEPGLMAHTAHAGACS